MAGKKITGRTKQLSLKSTPEFHKELKSLATEQKCLMIEILEKAFEDYKNKLVKKEEPESVISKIEVPQIRVNKRSLADDTEEELSSVSKRRKISDRG